MATLAPRNAAARVVIENQKKLERDLLKLRRDVVAGLRVELLKTAEAVTQESTDRVLHGPDEVSHMADDSRWAEFRLGITTSSGIGALGLVGLGPTRTPMMYVAPKARRRGGSPRGNLAPLLQKVMQASADKYEPQVWAEVEALVDAEVAKANLT